VSGNPPPPLLCPSPFSDDIRWSILPPPAFHPQYLVTNSHFPSLVPFSQQLSSPHLPVTINLASRAVENGGEQFTSEKEMSVRPSMMLHSKGFLLSSNNKVAGTCGTPVQYICDFKAHKPQVLNLRLSTLMCRSPPHSKPSNPLPTTTTPPWRSWFFNPNNG